MADYDVLDIRLHGESIGTLTRLGRDRIVLAFDPGYADDPARATLSLSFHDPFGNLFTDNPPTRTWTPPYFSNLLPEGPLREFLARGAGMDSRSEFPLLAALGADLPGAVTIIPLEAGRDRALTHRAAWRTGFPSSGDRIRVRGTPDSIRDPAAYPRPAFSFSLPGVQPKLPATMAATGRLTIPERGIGGSWIVKLPMAAFPKLPNQEHAMMSLAARVGIEVPETRLVPVDSISNLPRGMGVAGGRMALAVRRFDRAGDGTPVHVEDFAQVLAAYPEQKYLNACYIDIAEAVGTLIGEEAVCEFVRRLVFCTLIGNGDAHLKNWGVIYPDRRTPALAPAYDLVSTIDLVDDDRMALDWMEGARGFADLSDGMLRRLASSARVPQKPVVTAARRTVEAFMEAWRESRFARTL